MWYRMNAHQTMHTNSFRPHTCQSTECFALLLCLKTRFLLGHNSMVSVNMCVFVSLAEKQKIALKPCQGKSNLSHNNKSICFGLFPQNLIMFAWTNCKEMHFFIRFVQEAGPSGRGGSQRGLAPTRRALFATRLQEADQWSVAASRNLDAPEMGSPPNSDDEEDDGDGDDSSSGSSTEVTRSPLASCLTANPIMQFLFCNVLLLLKSSISDNLCSPCVLNYGFDECHVTSITKLTTAIRLTHASFQTCLLFEQKRLRISAVLVTQPRMTYIGLPSRACCYSESHSICQFSSDSLDATQLRSHLASPQDSAQHNLHCLYNCRVHHHQSLKPLPAGPPHLHPLGSTKQSPGLTVPLSQLGLAHLLSQAC